MCLLINGSIVFNCAGKQTKHEAFASEVASNEPRIVKNRETAEELIATDHYMSDTIRYAAMSSSCIAGHILLYPAYLR